MSLRCALVTLPRDAALGLDPAHDRLVAVGLVDRVHVLEDGGRTLQAEAGVHVLFGERRQRPVGVELVLHEDEVPELEEPVAARARRCARRIAAAALGTPVPVDLGVRAARPGPSHRPEVLRARQADDPFPRHADRLPEVDRNLVFTETEPGITRVNGHPDPLPGQTEPLADELGRVLDRALLEVLAEREVAEHLEEGQVVAVESDLVDVRRPKAFLRRRRERRGRLLTTEEVRHLRLHARSRQECRVVVGARNERPRRQTFMTLLLEEREEAFTELRRGAHDPIVALRPGWNGVRAV